MCIFGYITKEDIKENNPNLPEVIDHHYRILIVGSFCSIIRNALFNLTNQEPDMDHYFFYPKDSFEVKY